MPPASTPQAWVSRGPRAPPNRVAPWIAATTGPTTAPPAALADGSWASASHLLTAATAPPTLAEGSQASAPHPLTAGAALAQSRTTSTEHWAWRTTREVFSPSM